jgi:hypothetical protein
VFRAPGARVARTDANFRKVARSAGHKALAMKLLQPFHAFLPRALLREYAIRSRLLRSALSPASIRAERRADVLLISYPKCGRTWLTLLLVKAMAEHAGVHEFDPLSNDLLGGQVPGLPHVRISHDDDPHWKTPRALGRSKRRYRDKKVLLLVRDPRDVVVSMYFERTKRERAYDGTLSEFLREERGSLATILGYYDVWARERAVPRALCLVRYEDLRAEPARELRRILAFLGLAHVSDEHVAAAVAYASFENMRSMEVGDVLQSGRLRARDPGDPESYKTRKGKVGGYRDYLQPAEVEWMERRIREQLDPWYGYDSAAPSARPAPAAAIRTGFEPSLQEVTP